MDGIASGSRLRAFPPNEALEYELSFRQQVGGARSNGQRPMDASPIIRLRTRSRSHPEWRPPANASTYLLFASLVSVESDQELYLAPGGKEKYIKGSIVSSLTHLKELQESSMSAYFIFPDLGIRVDGNYRFKMTLYQLTSERVEYCTEIFSSPFPVVHGTTKQPVWPAPARLIPTPIRKPLKRRLSPTQQDGSKRNSGVAGSPLRPSVSTSALLDYGDQSRARQEPFTFQPMVWGSDIPPGHIPPSQTLAPNQNLGRRNSFEMRPGPPSRMQQQYAQPSQHQSQHSQYANQPQQSQHPQQPYRIPLESEYNYLPSSRGDYEPNQQQQQRQQQKYASAPHPQQHYPQAGTLNYPTPPQPSQPSQPSQSGVSSLAGILQGGQLMTAQKSSFF